MGARALASPDAGILGSAPGLLSVGCICRMRIGGLHVRLIWFEVLGALRPWELSSHGWRVMTMVRVCIRADGGYE